MSSRGENAGRHHAAHRPDRLPELGDCALHRIMHLHGGFPNNCRPLGAPGVLRHFSPRHAFTE